MCKALFSANRPACPTAVRTLPWSTVETFPAIWLAHCWLHALLQAHTASRSGHNLGMLRNEQQPSLLMQRSPCALLSSSQCARCQHEAAQSKAAPVSLQRHLQGACAQRNGGLAK